MDSYPKGANNTEMSAFDEVVWVKIIHRDYGGTVNVGAQGHHSFKSVFKVPDLPSEHFIYAALKLHYEHWLSEVQNYTERAQTKFTGH